MSQCKELYKRENVNHGLTYMYTIWHTCTNIILMPYDKLEKESGTCILKFCNVSAVFQHLFPLLSQYSQIYMYVTFTIYPNSNGENMLRVKWIKFRSSSEYQITECWGNWSVSHCEQHWPKYLNSDRVVCFWESAYKISASREALCNSHHISRGYLRSILL